MEFDLVQCDGVIAEKQQNGAGWRSLFGSDLEPKLQFHQPNYIPESVHSQGLSIWTDSLIGQIYGPAPIL